MDKCGTGADTLYRVRWQGYTAKDDTWVLRSNLGSALDCLTEFETSAKAKAQRKAKFKLSKPPAASKRSQAERPPHAAQPPRPPPTTGPCGRCGARWGPGPGIGSRPPRRSSAYEGTESSSAICLGRSR